MALVPGHPFLTEAAGVTLCNEAGFMRGTDRASILQNSAVILRFYWLVGQAGGGVSDSTCQLVVAG